MQTENREWSEEELQEVLRYYGRHLVAIVLAYRIRNANGELEPETHISCLTAFVISVNDHWHMLTAGHLIDTWRPAMASGYDVQIVRMSLADYFGIGATRREPLQFNLFEQPMRHAYSQRDDIDYAIIAITGSLRERLVANGILPLFVNESRTNYDDMYGFGLVGFPEELAGLESDDSEGIIAGVQPVLVPLRHVPLPTPRDRRPAFIADVIDMGNQRSVVGMSGGPILGYRMGNDGRSQYELVAIQSQWNGVDRILACPAAVALAEARAAIRSEQVNDQPDEVDETSESDEADAAGES